MAPPGAIFLFKLSLVPSAINWRPQCAAFFALLKNRAPVSACVHCVFAAKTDKIDLIKWR